MNVSDLLAETQLLFVSDSELGASEEIVYQHKASALTENTRAFIGGNIFSKYGSNDTKNESDFASVYLVEEPSKLDTILFGGKSYKIRSWLYANGLYYFNTEESKRNNLNKDR